jgi:hypothetical protein
VGVASIVVPEGGSGVESVVVTGVVTAAGCSCVMFVEVAAHPESTSDPIAIATVAHALKMPIADPSQGPSRNPHGL